MKMSFAEKQTAPVPRRGKVIFVLMCMVLLAASVTAGILLTPKGQEIPVALANGEVITPPWYITVDGEKVALVESKEAAQKVMRNIVEEYDGSESDNQVLDIEVREETGTKPMELKNGDEPPEILSVKEAEEKLMAGNDGDSYITVVTTEEQTEQEPIEFQQEYKPEPDLYVGQHQVEVEGEEGTREVTRKIVKENGQPVEEKIIEEEILEEPQQEVILTGTKKYEGQGGSEIGHDDEGVSYDLTATYETLYTPVDTIYISSSFGERWGSTHRGVDLALAQGSNIYAADGGKVYYAGYCGGYGNLVKIDHGNGMQTYYAHCSELLVSEGQQVARGEKIALVGSTGNSTGPHLHFEIIINKGCVNPVDFLDIQ